MSLFEVIMLGVALACDSFAVTVSNTFVYANEKRSRLALMPLFFGAFQGLMPVAGYFLGGLAASIIVRYAGIVTLVILGFIGGNMIKEGYEALKNPEDAHEGSEARLTIVQLFFQAIATAIDAFAVGVSLRAESVDLLSAVTIIGVTTALLCVVALILGRKLGKVLGDRAEIAGGIVLLIIGLKAFLS